VNLKWHPRVQTSVENRALCESCRKPISPARVHCMLLSLPPPAASSIMSPHCAIAVLRLVPATTKVECTCPAGAVDRVPCMPHAKMPPKYSLLTCAAVKKSSTGDTTSVCPSTVVSTRGWKPPSAFAPVFFPFRTGMPGSDDPNGVPLCHGKKRVLCS
jgi:hypothetical protein